METYSPKGFNLPPLVIEKRASRKNIENDTKVKNFIDTKLLLDRNFNNLFVDVLEKSREILKVSVENPSYKDFAVQNIFDYFSSKKFNNKIKSDSKKTSSFNDYLFYFTNKLISDPEFVKIDNKSRMKFLNNIFLKTKEKLIQLNEQIENEISDYEKKYERVKLDILSSTNFYFCKQCNKIVSKGKFIPIKCLCGKEINKVSEVDKKSISHFNVNLVNFINSNYWLEFGVGHLLKQNNYRTLIGYDVLGNSGVFHEVDNIVYVPKENFRFLCECKNSPVNNNDIFVFSGKMTDIGVNKGYLFSTSSYIQKEIIRLGRSKNIDMISDILNKNSQNIRNEIKEV